MWECNKLVGTRIGKEISNLISMKYWISAVVFLVLSALALNSDAQQKLEKFTREPEKFIKELSDMFDGSKKGTGKDFVEKEFGPLWGEAPAFSASQQEQIYNTMDLMLKSKSKIFPDMNDYLHALIAFTNAGKTDLDFVQWQEVLTKMLSDKKVRKFAPDFLESSYNLFADLVFFKNDAVSWKSSSQGYQFVYDSVPHIDFAALDLKCLSRGDSSVIYKTKGKYFPTLERFYGEGGTVVWSRAGFDPTKTYAQLPDYNIRIRGSVFRVDSVVFYNEFFEKPLLGALTEKIIADKTTDNATYPRFESYYKRLQIQNIVKNVDYDGGFTMAGVKLAGSGTVEEPALLTFFRESKKFLIVRSLEYDIKPDRITSNHVSVTFLLNGDSITHPDLNFSFDRKTRQLVLLRTEEGVSNSAFQNTYHDVEMYFEAIYWNIDDPLMKLGSLEGSTAHDASFESINYFKKKRYESMMGISFNHPLFEIKDFARASGQESFYAKELAAFHHSSEEQWHLILIDLNNKGFVTYDLNTRLVRVREKLFAYLENNIGKRDYDVIQFNSIVEKGANAQLSLLNYELLMKGVQTFQLSDSQKVDIYPQNGEVILKKDRDFSFGGRVFAGNFEFLGTEYAFSYKDFRLDLLKVDSCRIYVEDETQERGMNGQTARRRLKSVLRDLAGSIKVDAPTNKGGYHSGFYPQYPVFTCTKTSYVYWDNPSIQKGVYKRDKFFYQVEPFTIDSLDNFTKKDLKFNGTLVSGGIFPDITEPLVLMPDYSLGFNRNTGDGGLPAYAGKAKVTADLKLDYSGLKGGGKLDYLTASALSNEFTFLPDSTLGRTSSFTNREQLAKVEIPKASCDSTKLAFYPTKEKLNIQTIQHPIDFFEKEADLKGTLSLQPSGMTGQGDMTFSGAKLSSDLFKYKRRVIDADTANFQLAGMDEGSGLAFKTNNVNAHVDFDKRQGVFKSNSGETKIEFPTNEYMCYMDQFTWYMDRAEMDLSSSRKAADDLVIDTSDELKRSNFFSTAAGQDSLNFLSPRAKYDLKASMITCSKIDYIIVADSKVTPDSGKVVIQKYANMQPLHRAQILSNYVTQFHKIFNSELKIEGRKKYSGSGDYNYADENKKMQIIHFDDIKVDTSLQTVAFGDIKEDAQFFLSPAYEYYGKFEMAANKQFLTFDGGTRILHNCETMPRTYFQFRAEINPLEIYIPVDTMMRSMEYNKLGAGIMVSDDSPMEVYPAFLSQKKDKDDRGVIDALGYLYYNKYEKKYYIGSKEKIKQPKLPGNLFSMSAETCQLDGNGKLNFNVEYGLVKMQNVGIAKYNTTKNDMEAQGVCFLNFPMEDGAMKRLANQIEQWPNLTPVDVAKTQYERGLVELLGTEKSDKLISELNLSGQLKRVPEELQGAFYIADVKWVWNAIDESFQSSGPIGIASMDKKQLFRYVKGKIEIEKRRSADMLRIYLELDPGTWYYFEYKLGVMNVISSDKDFVQIITDLKDDKRKFEENNIKYTFQIMTSRKKRDDFVARFPEFQ
jgi:hypothetical protein